MNGGVHGGCRVEEHPPGEKAMHDFEDVVNYRYSAPRKRRGVAEEGEEERGGGAGDGKPVTFASTPPPVQEMPGEEVVVGATAPCPEKQQQQQNEEKEEGDAMKEEAKAEEEMVNWATTKVPGEKKEEKKGGDVVTCVVSRVQADRSEQRNVVCATPATQVQPLHDSTNKRVVADGGAGKGEEAKEGSPVLSKVMSQEDIGMQALMYVITVVHGHAVVYKETRECMGSMCVCVCAVQHLQQWLPWMTLSACSRRQARDQCLLKSKKVCLSERLRRIRCCRRKMRVVTPNCHIPWLGHRRSKR